MTPNVHDGSTRALVRRHLLVTLAVTCITSYFSYAYFHMDEYFQVLEFTRRKLDPASVPEMPWEHTERIRPWLQPFAYWLVARVVSVFGIRDLFDLAFVFRLLTGLCNVGALALYLRTTLAWFETSDARLFHVRVAAWTGFLPYLFVRTSSESGSMAALTAGFALLLEGARPGGASGKGARAWTVPALGRDRRMFVVGLVFGLAFEMRFQTLFVPAGLGAWLLFAVRPRRVVRRAILLAAAGFALAIGLGALVDRWGYGEWCFPPFAYLRVNVLEGMASLYGNDPPFAYLWMLPANVFFPVVAALVVLAVVAWIRAPFHPLTWATLPFVLVHNLLSHKEERFLFPLAILATGLVTVALRPGAADAGTAPGRLARIAGRLADWGWAARRRWPGKLLVGWSFAAMALLAVFPLGWHLHTRCIRALHDRFGDEVHATVFPEIELDIPAFHPRVWDLEKADPDAIARRIADGSSDEWLITPNPAVPPEIDARALLVYSELPGATDPTRRAALMRVVDLYNASAPAPFRRLRYHSLYRIDRGDAVSAPRPARP